MKNMKNYWGSLKANIIDHKEQHKKRLIYFLIFTMFIILAFLLYFLLTGKKPLSLIPIDEFQQPSYSYSIYGSGKMGELNSPLGLAVSSKLNRVYVTDNGNQRVAVFDLEGKPLFTFSRIKKKTLLNPIYLALDKADNIYVSDTTLSRICIFNKDGEFIKFFKSKERFNPLGLYVDNKNDLYVADKNGGRIIKFDRKGKVLTEYGKHGQVQKMQEGVDKLYFPNNVLVEKSGNVMVTDSNNKRIQVFASDGSALGVIPIQSFFRGLAGYGSSKDRYYFSAKVFGQKIAAFKSNGELLYEFGEEGPGDGQFSFPNDLTVLGNRIYIADRGNNRIQVWSF